MRSFLGPLFAPRYVWSFALYLEDGPFFAAMTLDRAVTIFDSSRSSIFGKVPHTQADPFVFRHAEYLYVFYEEVVRRDHGKIACKRTRDFEKYDDIGIVLAEPHHLSFPTILEVGGQIYLVAEAAENGEVPLYRFEDFPRSLKHVRSLILGKFADPVIYRSENLWFIFITGGQGLELFFTDDLVAGEVHRHPCSPITSDSRYSRSGGVIIEADGKRLRVAQDCSEGYGQNVHMLEITNLSPTEYSERVVRSDFFRKDQWWNRNGAHHLSVACFNDRTVIASDGRHRDRWVNRVLQNLPWNIRTQR